jgi:hypothetical protein
MDAKESATAEQQISIDKKAKQANLYKSWNSELPG